MVSIEPATGPQIDAWIAEWSSRTRARLATVSSSSAWIDWQVALVMADSDSRRVYAISDSGVSVGVLVVAESTYGNSTIVDLWVEPDHRRRRIGTEARAWAEEWAGERTLLATVDPASPAAMALFRTFSLRSQLMLKPLRPDAADPAAAVPPGLVGRPMSPLEYSDWRQDAILGYANDLTVSGSHSLAEAMQRSVTQFDELMPDGLDTPDQSFWIVESGRDPVATIWLIHHRAPDMSFVCDVEVREAQRGRGYGRGAMLIAERSALAVGDTQLGLNVFGHNQVATNLYTSLGYQVVEQTRSRVMSS